MTTAEREAIYREALAQMRAERAAERAKAA
jgi:hypothetical protein